MLEACGFPEIKSRLLDCLCGTAADDTATTAACRDHFIFLENDVGAAEMAPELQVPILVTHYCHLGIDHRYTKWLGPTAECYHPAKDVCAAPYLAPLKGMVDTLYGRESCSWDFHVSISKRPAVPAARSGAHRFWSAGVSNNFALVRCMTQLLMYLCVM